MEKIKFLYFLLVLVVIPCYAEEVTQAPLPLSTTAEVQKNDSQQNIPDESSATNPDAEKASEPSTSVKVSEPEQQPSEPLTPQDILELRPFVVTPKPWIPYIIGIIVLFLVVLIYLFLRKKKQRAASIIPLSPYERALHEIEATREWIHEAQSKRFASGLSDAIRGYIESVFTIRAIESTTEELLRTIQPLENLDNTLKDELKSFLEGCDLIKFTKQTSSPQGREGLYSAAKQWINHADKIRQAQAMSQADNTFEAK